ncbi:MAG TPA: oligosaccharide flippase family protein [Baekduia sp.]|nr:oligosaccharide flippase family protein [Baekduia sp.]
MTAQPGAQDVLDSPDATGRVARGGVLRVAAFAGGILLGLVGVVALTRHLGPAGYGRYQAVTALVAIVAALGDAGLGTLALRSHAQAEPPERDRVLDAVLGLRLLLALAGVAVAALAAVVLGYDGAMIAGGAIAAGAALPNAVAQTASVPLQTALRIGTVAALDLARQAVTTALVLALVAAGAGLVAFLAVPVPAALALMVATAAVARAVPRPALSRADSPRLLRDGAVVGLATASGVLYLYTSLIVCQLVATPDETGWFSASFRVIIIVAAVPALLGTSAFPLLARAAVTERARLARVASGLVEGSVLLGGAATLGAVLGAPAIIAVVAGDGYDAAIAPLRIQGVALGLTFTISALGFTLLARHRHRALVLCNAIGFAASAGVVAVLAAAHGERGAATGAAIAEVVLCAAYAIAVLQDVPLRPRRLPRILLALAAGLAAGAVAPVPAVPAVAIGLLVYGAAAAALRAVPAEAARALRPTMGRR